MFTVKQISTLNVTTGSLFDQTRKLSQKASECTIGMLTTSAITFFVIHTLEAVLIITGNLLALFVFWSTNLRQQKCCLVLINLAIADLLVGIAEPFVLATEKIPRKPPEMRGHEGNTKNPSSSLQVFASSSSVFFLALISLERVFSVLWPLHHRRAKLQSYTWGIVIAWFAGLVMCILSLLPLYLREAHSAYVSAIIHSCLFVSLLIICVSYVTIRARLRFTPGNHSNHQNVRLSRTMFAVIAVSLVFWLPAFVVYSAKGFCPPCFPHLLMPLVNALHLANSMVNPFVYAFKMPAFRNALRKLWRRRRKNVEIRPARARFGWH